MRKPPPINPNQDRDLDAFYEKKEVNLTGCRHQNARVVDGQIRCDCGASWGGARLNKLLELLTKN